MLTKPPYVVKSEGWGEFEIGVQVVFKYGLGEWAGAQMLQLSAEEAPYESEPQQISVVCVCVCVCHSLYQSISVSLILFRPGRPTGQWS